MIPLTLEISNFLSYREQATLDFRGIHLACISGANGAGKSSILDAMTWSLFGQSRSKSDDDLVNRIASRNDEWAEVRFAFSIEDSIYRITRRKRAGRSTVLELQLATAINDDGEPSDWKALTESKVRETQTAIETILRMNFDSFINASFFLQGKADEFTTKTPARRKEILAELLGINVWDTYKEKFTAERKTQEEQIRLQEARITEIDEELTQEDERKQRVEQLTERYEQVQAQLTSKEAVLQNLRQVETAVNQQKQQLAQQRNSRERAQQTLTNLQQNKKRQESDLAQFQTLLGAADKIKSQYKKWQSLNETVQAWQQKANQHSALREKMEPHRLAIAQEKTRLEQQIGQLEQQQQAAQRAKEALLENVKTLESSRSELAKIEVTLEQFKAQTAALEKAKSQLQAMEGERNLWQKEAQTLEAEAARIAQAEKMRVQHQEQADAARSQLEQLAAQLADLQAQTQEQSSLTAELAAIEGEMPHLRSEMDVLKGKMEQLQNATEAACPLCGQPLSDEHRQDVIAEMKTNGTQMGDRFRAHQQRKATISERLPQLKTAVSRQATFERQQTVHQNALAQATAQMEEGVRVLKEWEENGRLRLEQLTTMLSARTELDALEAEVSALEAALIEKHSLEQQQQAHQKTIAQSETRQQALRETIEAWEETGQDNLAVAKRTLEAETYAQEAQTALAKLQSEADALQYDAYEHHEATEAVEKLADAPQQHQALQEAEINRTSLLRSIESLDEQIASQQETVTAYEAQIAENEASLAKLADSGDNLAVVEEEVKTLRDASIAATRDLGAAQQAVDVLAQQQERREKLTAEKKEQTDRLQKLQMLEEACGRNGVQALLIEAAKPQIEERANELLERLTGGNMRVMFETQRELKSKKATKVETFDIRIQDGAGERPYENYSGGEQFRVNFAIRLALSQILARRAGAKLQTLVIDEGFGSQDPNGRQRLIEAINTIQSDFERILVITHIEALREAFPTQISVEKTLGGSQISVN